MQKTWYLQKKKRCLTDYTHFMPLEILSANVFLYPKAKTNIPFIWKERKTYKGFLWKKNEKSKPRIFVKNFSLQTLAGRPLKSDQFRFARVAVLSAVDGQFFLLLTPRLSPHKQYHGMFLHVFARNSNQELMKASIAAGKNH